jgi:NADH-quinone oxidoreductase subunit C
MDYHGLVDRLKEEFPKAILGYSVFREELTVEVDFQSIVGVGTFLRDNEPFKMDVLTDLAGIDKGPEQSPRLAVVYILTSTDYVFRMKLKIHFNENDPVSSVSDIWASANWLEREAWEMYGIKFTGHPDLRKLLLSDDLEGYPMRKDFPTKGYHFEKPVRV